MLSSISRENGLEHFQIFKRSVNVDKYIQWVTKLRELNGEARICLFMDQLSSHKAERAKKAMRELGFRFIYNRSYSPELNPIELVFSKVKHTFKTLRAKKLVGNIQGSHEALAARVMRSVRKQDVVNCVNHVN